MERRFAELFDSARKTMQFCQVKPEEQVVVFRDSGTSQALTDAFHSAALATGAEVTVVSMTTRPGALQNPPEPAINALCAADVVFDLASHAWLYTEATNRILVAGTRMLQLLVGEDTVVARPPTSDIAMREEVSRRMLEGSNEFRITTELGTDITLTRGDRPVHTQGGFVDHAGDWDSYGVFLAAFAPPETEADGVLVIDGTLFLPTEYKLVTEAPIRTVVERGRLVDVDTSTAQGRLLKEWLAGWNDPNSYVIAHTGFGLDERAKFEAPDSESYLAGVNIAFGANNIPQLRGATKCRSHVDIVLRGATVELDGKKVIDGGQFVEGYGFPAVEPSVAVPA
jgi:2,5-dihydroxypyridine 5,6-dioxygenase